CRVANPSPHRAGSGFTPYRKAPCWAHKNKEVYSNKLLYPLLIFFESVFKSLISLRIHRWCHPQKRKNSQAGVTFSFFG
ncbi:hypothetical protein, partial [Turicimonas muris]|uniref:hypothetical protein n=1 Tax=Turicimonas muris TaxID=1796652 RepID=UPI003F6723BE